jgi:hypothetical protein
MSREKLISALKAGTLAPPGSQERVWRRLRSEQAPPRRRSSLVLALAGAASLVAGAAVVLALTAPRSSGGDRFALAGERAAGWELDGHTVVLRRGTVTASVWGGPLTVRAGRHQLFTEAALFAVKVAGDTIELDLHEGSVLLDGARRVAPWRQGAVKADVPAVQRLEASGASEARAWIDAEGALARGDLDRAAQRFAAIGSSDSLRAEAGLMKAGELSLRLLHRPQEARDTFDRLRARFPQGALRQEAELSALEASAQLSDWAAVRERAERFLTAFPRSERADEVRRLALRANEFER